MRINLKLLAFIVAILILAAVTGRTSHLNGIDPGVADSLIVDSMVVLNSGGVALPFFFYNDQELAGIEITLHHDSPDLIVDSFSFVGGRVDYVSLKGWSLNNDRLMIYLIPFGTEPLITTGEGLLGSLHFSYPPSASVHVATIDTVTFGAGQLIYSTAFSTADSKAFSPIFEKGFIDMQLGNCCLGTRGNANADIDERVNVSDITYLVNYLFGIPLGPPPACMEEGNINGDALGDVNVADLTYMVNYLFGGGPAPVSCP